jgi:hypothetical protein
MFSEKSVTQRNRETETQRGFWHKLLPVFTSHFFRIVSETFHQTTHSQFRLNRSAMVQLPRWFDAVWLAILAIYIMAGVRLVPLHGDETTQIYMARDFYALFIERDTSQLTYRAWETLDGQEATRQDLRLKDGVLHRYLFGAAAYLGGYSADELNEQWEWGSGWDWNHQHGHVPTDDLLFRARYVSAGMLVFGVWVLFAIARQVGGRGTAYIATLLYTINPALLLNGRRAMMEGALTFFSLLVVLAALWVLQSRKWWAYLLLGLASGLAVASKHTGAVTVAAVFMACGLVFVYEGLRRKQGADAKNRVPTKHIAYLILAGILSLLIFYTLNPAWWSNPMARVGNVSDMRLDFMQSQQEAFGGYETMGARLEGFWRQTFMLQNMYAETDVDNFRENLVNDIAAYEASGYGGLVTTNLVLPFIFAGLTVIGLIALWLDTTVNAEIRFIVGVWIAAMLVLTVILTPLEWQRYYLPVFSVIMLLIGLGVRFIFRLIQHRLS